MGQTFTLHSLEWIHDYMEAKVKGFEELTGANIRIAAKSTQNTWFADVKQDVEGAGIIDLYSIFGNWIPTFADKGGLKSITTEVREQVGLDWLDIMPAVRQGVATYNEEVYAVPVDGDVIIMLYREDLVEDVGLPTPNSWDDVMEIIDYYKDKDFTDDDEADYATCFSTAQSDIAGTMFWSIASTFLQTKGTSQGAFFDPETFEPASANPIFEDILEMYNKLVQASPFRDHGEYGWQDNLAEFQSGRCVLWFNYPGPTRVIVSNQKKNGQSGILRYQQLPGMNCDKLLEKGVECTFPSKDGNNHAPFLASGGMSFAVSDSSSPERAQLALDFAFYMSDPDISYEDVAYPGSYLDPLRQRHTADLQIPSSPQSKAFLKYGWEERQLPMLKEVTEFNFLHDNYVLDLRILGSNEYQEANTVQNLVKMWKGEWTAAQTKMAITNGWNSVTETYGLSQQRAMYRKTIGLPPYVPPSNNRPKWEIIIPVVTVVSVILIILLAIVMKQRNTIKFKTRDVHNAPRDGKVAIIFTDIEGSTSLWESNRSIMSQALDVHHTVIRKIIQTHDAYEVKTIGDAFMIAVGSADAAVRIANDIQKELLAAEWSLQLASLPTSCVEYFPRNKNLPQQLMFSGLRIRIGVNIGEHNEDVEEGGEVMIKYDKIAKGYDYYGIATNAAARIEDLAFGGQTLISRKVLDELSDDVKKEADINVIGELDLRGCAEPMMIYQVLPSSLKGRRFQGPVRRRNSQDKSMMEDTLVTYPQSAERLDLEADVFSMTPIELQHAVVRLRKRLKDSILEKISQHLYSEEDQANNNEGGGDDDLSMSSLGSNESSARSILEDEMVMLNPSVETKRND